MFCFAGDVEWTILKIISYHQLTIQEGGTQVQKGMNFGVKGNYSYSDDLLLLGNVGIGYDAQADRTNLTSAFAGGGGQFTTSGIDPGALVYDVGVGVKYALVNGTEVTARYDLNGRDDYTDQSFSVNVRWMFY